MNAEQRAYFEYGMAYESAAMIRSHIRELLKQRGYRITTRLLHECRDGYASFGEAIRYVWEMRKACRIFCGQCVHFSPEEWGAGKDGCLKRYRITESGCNALGCKYYKPRKEYK